MSFSTFSQPSEIHHFFSLPQDPQASGQCLQILESPSQQGFTVSISHVGGLPNPWPRAFDLTKELQPGKWAVVCLTESQ